MNKVIELASKCGFVTGKSGSTGEEYIVNSNSSSLTEKMNSFYHATRAELLMELMLEIMKPDTGDPEEALKRIKDKADRDGK